MTNTPYGYVSPAQNPEGQATLSGNQPQLKGPGGNRKVMIAWGVGILVAILSLFIEPAFLGLAGIIVCIMGIVRWVRAGKAGKAGSAASKATPMLMTFIGAAAFLLGGGLTEPSDPGAAATAPASSQQAAAGFADLGASSPAPSPVATATEAVATSQEALSERIGEQCDDDRAVVSQGSEKLYCDADAAGALTLVSAATHRQAEAAASAEASASAQAAAGKKAEEEAAASEAAAAELAETSTYYANCTEVRAAHADPLYRGEPGYSSKLDRDGDGVACE